MLEYRRSYQKKIMIVSRNKDNKQLKKDFDNWKKEAQAKIKLFRNKTWCIEVYRNRQNWILENFKIIMKLMVAQ